LQSAKDFAAQIFCGRHYRLEHGNLFVQVLVVESVYDFAIHERIELAKIGNHTGGPIDGARNSNGNLVIVPVPVWVVTLAVDAAILLITERGRMQSMRRGKLIPARE
jgi:hypothetical protein